MKANTYRNKKYNLLGVGTISFGIAVNVIISYVSYKLDLPIFLDTIGTIIVAAMGGLFPGIVTAVVTNLICTAFNDIAVYFGFVNTLVAIYVAWFVRKRSFRKIQNIILFILVSGNISGGISVLIQWGLFGGPQQDYTLRILSAIGAEDEFYRFFMSLVINICMDIIDKSISIAAALAVIHFIPSKARDIMQEMGWRQRPLSPEEIREMDEHAGKTHHSVKRRMTLMLLAISVALVAIISELGIRLYFDNTKQERMRVATTAADFAASVVNPDMIDSYIEYGKNMSGYKETEEMLRKIRENANGVDYLFVLQYREDGCYTVFDLGDENGNTNPPGSVLQVEASMAPYLSQLLAGEEIEPIETDTINKWALVTYSPVRDRFGKTVAYAGAVVSLSYMADYMGNFILRVLLSMSGLFVLILAYGMWYTGAFTTYPINSMALSVEDFIGAGTDQKRLDAAVRKLRALDIHTGDETEKLYKAICDMALNQTEQFRSLRRFSENTVKMQDGLIITMADLVENRDSDTGAHVQKTAAYVKIIVEGLKKKGYYAEKITPKFISDVVRSAPLHDIGKINIPDNVLNKPGKLTPEEYEIIKTHTTAGKEIMEKAISTVEGANYLKEARNMAAYHHERWDGTGYPEGLHGEVIPLSARIMAVADVFDALTSPRVYKPPFTLQESLAMLQDGAGTQFDPKCVEVFMDALPEVKVVLRKYNENVNMEVADE
ncbi:HD domain-containing phosphohydrolase [Butyrivibrio sp. AD3002]|uniref:HD domain-containing phosphohydrolase n=1 Tax=Butyrivibrio sp. AD3002 TaxID=1280670 RepID=UPI0003B43148|nr:HD domain-containing phosphohydrolase [Butyrivibrio sp. AD3002]